MKISNILIVLNLVGLALTTLWWYSIRDYEPIITGIGLIGALIVQLFVNENRKREKNFNMVQKTGNNSTNIQIGGNFNQK